MKLFNRVAIIGVGLIGGSVGLAVKKRRLAKEVIGIFRHASTMKRALKCKAVDTGYMSISEGVKEADLIIVAASVYSIPSIVRDTVSHAKQNAIITDVGSTKKWILDNIEGVQTYRIMKRPYRNISFVGSHPMAGSEHTGVEFARADLFKGSPCIVTKTNKTNKAALERIVNFWKSLGARVKIMTPEEHDRSVSLISHLPHIVAFSLASAVPAKELPYAAEGFEDTTRVASSDPNLWTEIFLSNKKQILNSARMFEKKYKEILKALKKDVSSPLIKLLSKAKSKRDRFIYGK